MILIVIGIVGAVLIALDARRNLQLGVTKTVFGTYSRHDDPAAFRIICGVKLSMSITLLGLAALLIVWNSA